MQENVVRKERMKTEKRVYTIKDIEALPEGERAELIDGEMFRMDSPDLVHQEILGELYIVVRQYIRSRGGKCKVYFSPFAVYINNDVYNYVDKALSTYEGSTVNASEQFTIPVNGSATWTMDAMARRTGWWRLFRLAVRKWIMSVNFLNTGRQGCRYTGLLIL